MTCYRAGLLLLSFLCLLGGCKSSSSANHDAGAAQDSTLGDASTGNPNLDFWSDWRTAVGSTTHALHDGGKWPANLGGSSGELPEVIDASGLGFPAGMNKVFRYRLQHEPPSTWPSYMLVADGQWAPPAVGEYWFVRFYIRYELDDGLVSGEQHFFHHGSVANGYDVMFRFSGAPSSGLIQLNWMQLSQPNLPDQYVELFNTFPTKRAVRVEARIHRLGPSTVGDWAIRIVDENAGNSLLADQSDFCMDSFTCTRSLGGDNPTLNLTNPSEFFTRIELGNNGPAAVTWPPTEPPQYGILGGFAIRVTTDANGWIGPYPHAEEN